ncbi:cysteine desulfurase [Verrucomicrobium sp. BvORR034]|uniref:cysteine desulfurase n=1 Tax=Verrucomicrobium sp. BvORR034 TaxID=1396418 RepID=UPI0009DFDF59|nr:cysteine desulfurase [Verrucomicrobium sp. BvORR034]
MTQPRPDLDLPLPDGLLGAIGRDGVDTDLISRLVSEAFRDGGPVKAAPQANAPVSLPQTVAGSGAHLPWLPSDPFGAAAAPVQESKPSSEPKANGLNGGFPSASSSSSSAPPPVHPTVVAAEPNTNSHQASTELDSGGHEAGEDDSYEFGEPRNQGSSFSPRITGNSDGSPNRVLSRSGGDHATPRDETPVESGLPGLYFLEGLRGTDSPLVASGLPKVNAPPVSKEFDVTSVRRDFPALHQRVNGHPLIWLDNAATTHKPQSVIDATSSFYGRDNSNIHRAAHALAERSTKLFEASREKVRQFLGAADKKEIVFVRGTTEGINLVAQSYGRQNIGAGDEILVSEMEHHANIVPWQLLARQVGANLRVIPMNDRGELLLEEVPRLINSKTKIVSITQVSNALGTINPVEEIIAIAHSRGVPVLVDGAQSTPHLPVNVQALDADFLVFSGHKVFGPTGIGALYGKSHLLESMPPWQGGGHMIQDVTFEKTVYNHAPEKFEAGTPDIAGVVGLGAAVDYLMRTGIPGIAAYEHALLEYATEALATVPGVRPIGTAFNKASVFGFVIPGIPIKRIADHLDQRGIAVRAGHHCALPALRHFGVEGTVRPSVAFYNTFAEIDQLIEALHELPRN